MSNQDDSTAPTPLAEAVEDAQAEGFKVSPDPAGGYLARMEPKLGCGPFFVYVILGGAMALTAFFYWASLIVAAFIGLAAYFWSGQGETFSLREAPDGTVEWAVRRNRNGTYKWIAWVAAGIAFIGFVVTYPSDSDTANNPSQDEIEMGAWDVCKQQVESQLKAPATAGFPMRSEFPIVQSGSTYTMSAWVDAQNSFGAQVRTKFKCVATHTGGPNFTVSVTLE